MAITFVMELDSLDSNKATYTSKLHTACFILPRKEWEILLRPGEISAEVNQYNSRVIEY